MLVYAMLLSKWLNAVGQVQTASKACRKGPILTYCRIRIRIMLYAEWYYTKRTGISLCFFSRTTPVVIIVSGQAISMASDGSTIYHTVLCNMQSQMAAS
jgi:hypothetical protein